MKGSDVMGLVVRPLTSADAGAVAAHEVESFGSPWSEAAVTTALEHPTSRGWIAEGSGDAGSRQTCGFVLFRVVAPESELLRLAVAPSHRRLGVASELLQVATSALFRAQVRQISLEVRSDNTAARRLYAAWGFEALGRRRSYYADGGDALTLLAKLS